MFIHICGGLATCALLFPLIGQASRNRRIARWSRQLLGMCGVRVRHEAGAHTAAALEHAMIVANHVSWLDIFVINSLHPSRFVAKAEIRDWPVLGWLAEMAGTVFIARSQRRELRNLFKGLVACLQAGERVAFFPEGTTAAQGQLLPFHANLFEAAVDAGVPVQPYSLLYTDRQGAPHQAIDFLGEMTFVESLVRILSGPPVQARVGCLAPLPAGPRRQLAEQAHAAIAAALAPSFKP